MNTLNGQPTKRAITAALQELAKGEKELEKAYGLTMARIQNQEEGNKKLAEQTLAWIIHAKRPLSMTELRHALVVRPHDSELHEYGCPSLKTILFVCAGLVRFDEKSKIFDLVHTTTREYFENLKVTWFPDAEKDIATTCVTYISFNIFESGFCQTGEELEERLRSYPFYDYAAYNWGHHARAAAEVEKLKLEQLILDLLENEAKVSSCSQAMMASDLWYNGKNPTQMTGVHLVAYFGLRKAMIALL
jgi:hypothetical protein